MALAYASVLTEMIRGRSLEEVRGLSQDDLGNRFGTELGATKSLKLVFFPHYSKLCREYKRACPG